MAARPLYALSWFFFCSRRRHTTYLGDWSSDVCSSDLRSLHVTGVGERWRVPGGHHVTSSSSTTCALKIGRASCRERVYSSLSEECVIGYGWVRASLRTRDQSHSVAP